MSDSSAPAGQLNTSSLEQRCLHFLAQGLAPSTRKAYASGQRKFVEFCRQAGKLHSNGSPCPADEWTLCLFVSFLADSIQHSSIKVSLSAVRSLHIEQGFPDPLLNCLRLQRPRLLSAFQLLTAFSWSFIRRWISRFSIIAPFGQPACWVILVFSVLLNLQFPI